MVRLSCLALGLSCFLLTTPATAQVVIDFDNLPGGAAVTSQYPYATFSSSAGNANKVLAAGADKILFTGPVGGAFTGVEDTYVDFLYPVDGLTLTAVEPNGAGVVATFNVYEDGVLTASVPLNGLGGPGSLTVDLSAYQSVTRLEIVGIDPDPAENGIGWDDFSFTPDLRATIDFDALQAEPEAIGFEELPSGTAVTDQYPLAIFSSSPGNENKVLAAGANKVLFTGPVGGAFTGVEDTYIDFLYPVEGLTFTAIEPNGAGVVATFNVYEDGVLTASVPLNGLGGPGSLTVDLSAYQRVTRLEIVGIDPDPAENGIAWDDFSFTPSVTLVTGQYPLASFSSSDGNVNSAVWDGVGNVLYSGPAGQPPTGIEDTYIDFLYPVNDLTFTAVEPNGAGVVATFDVYEDGVLSASVPLNGLGGPGSLTVDLSAYLNVTRLEIVGIDPDPAEDGIGWDDFQFTPATQVTLDFDELSPGTVIDDEYVHATFSSSPGSQNNALFAGSGNVLISGPTGGPLTGTEDTYVDFLYPVNGLRLTAIEPNGAGVVASLRVFENGRPTADVPLLGLGGSGSKPVDLGAYLNVTRLEIVDIDTDPAENGVAWDDFTFTPFVSPYVYCTAQVNSAGCTPAISFSGSPSLAGGSEFVIEARNVIDNTIGILIHSPKSGNLPFNGGTICLGAPILRAGVVSSGGTPPCGGVLSLDFNAFMETLPNVFAPGQKVWAQYWSRDLNSPGGSNLTDAVAFVVGP